MTAWRSAERVAGAAFGRGPIAAAVTAVALFCGGAPAPVARAAGVVRETTRTPVRCAASVYEAPTDWYLPQGAPRGLVWAQHGFFETKRSWRSFATELAQSGDVVFATTLPTVNASGCSVENLGDNTSFLTDVASWFATDDDPHGALSRSFAVAARRAGRVGLTLPTRTAFIGHSAGGEAVLYVAKQLAELSPSAFGRLGGLVLADPVTSLQGDNIESALRALDPSHVPIYAIASPPSACNAEQSGTRAVEQLLADRPFVGAEVTSGSHGDVFGASVSALEASVCGEPRPWNVAATDTLAQGWLADEIAGSPSPQLYPGGAIYDVLVARGLISTLP